MPKSIFVPLERLVLKSTLQRRDKESSETITRYTEIYLEAKAEGTEPPFPPVVVFSENPKDEASPLLVGDGFHRVKAGRKAEADQIKVEIRKGGAREALLHALGANADHGLPLTLDERRGNAIELFADEEWRQWSDREISTHVHLSPNTIAKIRKQQGAVVDKVKGKDGVVRKKPSKPMKPKATTSPPSGISIDLSPVASVPNGYLAGLNNRIPKGDGDDTQRPILPPGIYIQPLLPKDCGECSLLISSEDLPPEVAVGAHFCSSYETGGKIVSISEPYNFSGCRHFSIAVKDNPKDRNTGHYNEVVYFEGKLRKLFAANNDRFAVGKKSPKEGDEYILDLLPRAVPFSGGQPAKAPTVAEAIAKIDQALAAPDPVELPPGVYFNENGTFISSEPLVPDAMVAGCDICDSTGSAGKVQRVTRHVDALGFVSYSIAFQRNGDQDASPSLLNNVVLFRGELRHQFANNVQRIALGKKKPKKGKDDSNELRGDAKPIHPPESEQLPTPPADPADGIAEVPTDSDLRELVRTDAPRLISAKVHGPSELIAKLVAALYHHDSRKHPRSVGEVAAATGFPVAMVERSIDTYPAGIEMANLGTYMLSEQADAEVDAILGDQATPAGAEPEELTIGEPAAPPRPVRQTAPLAERRAGWIRQQLAEQLERGPQLRCSEGETCALILLVGLDTRDGEAWSEDFVQTAIGQFNDRVAHSVADRLRRHETHNLPDWRLLAKFFGLDAESLSILAERTIPE